MNLLRSLGLLLLLLAVAAAPAEAQRVAKYGADFLAGGVGGRALGMGGAYVALANDVTAGYWNPAGLNATAYPEAAYMHAERFDGIVQFDYGAGVFPVNARSTVGISFFRSGVDDIANTLNAWDAAERPRRRRTRSASSPPPTTPSSSRTLANSARTSPSARRRR